MILIFRDDLFRYRIEAPEECELRIGHNGYDYVVVPDPAQPSVPYWLFDEILIEAARSGEFGLKLLGEQALPTWN